MQVQRDSVVFAFDFDRLTDGGLLYDYGPHGLHATPGAGAAAPTRQLDGSYSFDGGDYFELSGASQTRFYANAPTRELTFVFCAAVTLQNKVLFSTWNAGGGGINTGFLFQGANVASPSRINFYIMQGGAGAPDVQTAAGSLILPKRTVHVVTNETTPRYLVDQQSSSAAWVGGAFGTTVHNAAITPNIGRWSGGDYFVGNLYYMALLRGAVSSSDMAELSALLSNGVKPWTGRL